MRIIALGSHIDDIEFGCGGTLLRHRDEGDEIFLAITHADDNRGGEVRLRKDEQIHSGDILGTNDILFFFFFFPSESVVAVLDSIKADVLYFPFEEDYHQHHKETSKIGFAVARNRHLDVLKYLNQSSYSCYPNFIAIIDIEKKKELVSVFKSQNGRQPKFMEIMEAQNRYFGSLVEGQGLYAEGFVLHRMIRF